MGEECEDKPSKFARVVIGGTFDQLHRGHRRLIERALEVGDRVLIGLTSDDMTKRTLKRRKVADFEDRKRELVEFLRKNNVLDRVQILRISDPYGPTLTDGSIEVIVVSHETAERAEEINELRRERGLKPLEIVTIETVLAEDHVPISTTRIREKEIDREGRLL